MTDSDHGLRSSPRAGAGLFWLQLDRLTEVHLKSVLGLEH
jgi:hypothetical protein